MHTVFFQFILLVSSSSLRSSNVGSKKNRPSLEERFFFLNLSYATNGAMREHSGQRSRRGGSETRSNRCATRDLTASPSLPMICLSFRWYHLFRHNIFSSSGDENCKTQFSLTSLNSNVGSQKKIALLTKSDFFILNLCYFDYRSNESTFWLDWFA